MRATIIDGRAIANGVRAEVAAAAKALTARFQIPPGLAVLRVGDDPASKTYVNAKEKIARELGFLSVQHHLPASTSEGELLGLIARLNAAPEIHGILVQLPLPAAINASVILGAIAPTKDVDGLHPVNAGHLFLGRPTFVPCTPGGVMRLLEAAAFDPAGKRCTVIGRSAIVGRPMAMLLVNAHATVTVCHSRSDLAQELPRADLVVAAAGRAGLVRGDWLKAGSVVIDVGINRSAQGKLVGDVDFESAVERAGYITTVPGGVGPMTIAMLMRNTVQAAEAALTAP